MFLSRQVTKAQGNSQWLLLRKSIPTATDFSHMITHGNFIKNKFRERIENEDMKKGTLLEPISKRIFEKIRNVPVNDCGLIKHKTLNIGASPDGWIHMKNDKNQYVETPILIEIKNPQRRAISNLIPYNYWCQMQFQMFVCDLNKAVYFETSIKFTNELRQEDMDYYMFYGKCEKDLKKYGKYWYLEKYFMKDIVRDDEWLKEKLPTIEKMVEQLDIFNNDTQVRYFTRGRKRKLTEMLNDDTKSEFYWDENSMHNYLNNDTLSDYLNMFYQNYEGLYPERNPFMQAVSKFNKIRAGDLRENLYRNYGHNYSIQTVPDNYRPDEDLHKMTLRFMKEGHDIIVNPSLMDKDEKKYVKMFALIKGRVLRQETNLSINIDNEAYYPYIFKKKRLIVFQDNLEKLTNHRDMREIRCSALFHHEMVSKFQKRRIDRVFILGNGYQYNNNNKFDLNLQNELLKNKLQHVYVNKDPLRDDYKAAFKWLDLCKREGNNWNIFELKKTVPRKFWRYLLPNITVQNRWDDIKKELSEEYNDVGEFWQIGKEKRKECQTVYNILSWKDPKFELYIQDQFKNERRDTLLEMLKVAKNPKAKAITIQGGKVKFRYNNWHKKKGLNFYIDFETINKSTSELDIIYLIGMIVELPNGEQEYLSFMIDELTPKKEADMIEEWILKMDELKKQYKKEPNLFCWGAAETIHMNAVMDRIEKLKRRVSFPYKFIDMCALFKKEPILIKGAHRGFSLKIILPKMVEHGLIEETKYEEFCNRGDISIIHALDYYKNGDKKIRDGLIKYNKIDCAALGKIVNKIRDYC